jgi:hypothetical protein
MLLALDAKAQDFEIRAIKKQNGDVILDAKAQEQVKGLISAMDAEIARLQHELEKQKRETNSCRYDKFI